MDIMNKYIIFTTQRTGSTWLVDMLHSHSNIASYAELFRLTPAESFPTFGEKNVMLYERWKENNTSNFFTNTFMKRKAYQEYFNHIEELNKRTSNIKAFGCKVMYSQLSANRGLFDSSLSYINTAIHLKRRDHLNVAVSKAYMEQSKIVHSEKDVSLPPIKLDIKHMVQYLKKLKRDEEYFESKLSQQTSVKVMTCYYEDLVLDTAGEMARIHQHIGVEHIKPESNFKKVNNANLEDLVVNYKELTEAIKSAGL